MQQTILEESLINHVFILATVSASLILMGILFAPARTASLRTQIKAVRKIATLLAEDNPEKTVIEQSARIEE